jgi:hypothetical protein
MELGSNQYKISDLDRKVRVFPLFFFFFFSMFAPFGTVNLDEPSSLRLNEVRQATLPRLFVGLEVAAAKDTKLRNGAPIMDTAEGLVRFTAIANAFSTDVALSLFSVFGSERIMKQFLASGSCYLATVVTRFADLKLVPTPSLGAAKKNAASAAMTGDHVERWITATSGLIFLIIVEALMAMWQRPATVTEAVRMSLENAQASLRKEISVDDMLVGAALLLNSRWRDTQLAFASLTPAQAMPVFASDIMAHLHKDFKSKIADFDNAARMSLPATDSFQERLASAAGLVSCTAQLAAWAIAVKADKAKFAKEVKSQLAALGPVAGVPPPAAAPRPQGNRQGRPLHCYVCAKTDRVAAGHIRETCQFYKCTGCAKKAPGHIWRNCPNPNVGGPCPAHVPN